MKGAVRMWPWTRICKNSRHVPATGSRTPSVMFPGAVAWPVILVAPEDARAVRRAGGADVGVEVVQRAGMKEDGVGQRPEPRRELDLVAVRIGHVDVYEGGLDGVQMGLARHVEVVAVDDLVGMEGRQRLRPVGALHGHRCKKLEVGLPPGRLG